MQRFPEKELWVLGAGEDGPPQLPLSWDAASFLAWLGHPVF